MKDDTAQQNDGAAGAAFLKAPEVAALLRISLRTVKHISPHDLPRYKIRHAVRYRRTDVEAYLRSCQIE